MRKGHLRALVSPQPKKFKQTAIILISRDYSRKILLKDPDPTNGGEQDELLTRGR